MVNKVKALVNLRTKKSTFNPKLGAKEEKNSWVIDFIVCTPAGGVGVAGTHDAFPVSDMLVVDHYLEEKACRSDSKIIDRLQQMAVISFHSKSLVFCSVSRCAFQ